MGRRAKEPAQEQSIAQRRSAAELGGGVGAAATRARDEASVLEIVDGDHFNIIAPGEPQWAQVEDQIVRQVLAAK